MHTKFSGRGIAGPMRRSVFRSGSFSGSRACSCCSQPGLNTSPLTELSASSSVLTCPAASKTPHFSSPGSPYRRSFMSCALSLFQKQAMSVRLKAGWRTDLMYKTEFYSNHGELLGRGFDRMPLFAIHVLDRPGALPLRLEQSAAHRAYVETECDHGLSIVMSGPLQSDDG